MRRIEWITAVALILAIAVWWLPSAVRVTAWIMLAALYLGVCVWGSTRLSSRVFAIARWRGSPDVPRVALTYDDGPDPSTTPALLDLLAERGVEAAFFVVGEKVRKDPDVVRRCAQEGHLIGNHSDRHSMLHNFLGSRGLERELTRCQDAVESATGERPRHYRPPFGLLNHAVAGVCARLDLELIGWQVRSFDTVKEPAVAAARVAARLEPGSVVLLHDGGRPVEAVLDLTRRVLDLAEERGLEVVRVDRLLRG